ncbi:MAG: hypothetical protein AAF213_08905 [Pseudomonadota bacterium]
MPGTDSSAAFWIVCAILTVIALGVYGGFKRLGIWAVAASLTGISFKTARHRRENQPRFWSALHPRLHRGRVR